jgi:hypothetical protein
MFDNPIAPPISPSPFEEKPKTPVLGILSCVAAVVSILLVCGMFVLTYAMGSGSEFDPTRMSYDQLASLGFGIIGLCLGSGFFAIVGIILGIVAVLRKDTAKVWGILGLILNGLIVLSYCGLYALGALANSSGG